VCKNLKGGLWGFENTITHRKGRDCDRWLQNSSGGTPPTIQKQLLMNIFVSKEEENALKF